MQPSDRSINEPLEQKPEEPDKPVFIRGSGFGLLRGGNSSDYNLGYADGMRETMMILVTAMLVSVFLLVRYMKEA